METNEQNKILPISNHLLISDTEGKDNSLQLSKIIVNEDYRKKWNIHENDFVCLTKNGQLISNSLYRKGGLGGSIEEDYFMLLKHVEAFYTDEILRICESKDPNHLESRWCIIDKNGIEKVEFDRFKSPYITKDSQIYSIDSNYYNIETGEFYCRSSSSMVSGEYLFLENRWDKDESRRGVMKINKKNGSWELFS